MSDSVQEDAQERREASEGGHGQVRPFPSSPVDGDPWLASRSSHRRLRRRSRGERSRQHRLRMLKGVVGLGGALFFTVLVIMGGYISSLAGENDALVAELNRTQRALSELASRLAQVQAQRDVLVENRIPDLRTLEYDKVVPLHQNYVRNVIFTLARNGDNVRYEYRMVLHNDSLSVVHPEVEIVLFDEVGIQIGGATVDRLDASADTDRAALDPGEVRSYSGTISMLSRKSPQYFLVTAE